MLSPTSLGVRLMLDTKEQKKKRLGGFGKPQLTCFFTHNNTSHSVSHIIHFRIRLLKKKRLGHAMHIETGKPLPKLVVITFLNPFRHGYKSV